MHMYLKDQYRNRINELESELKELYITSDNWMNVVRIRVCEEALINAYKSLENAGR